MSIGKNSILRVQNAEKNGAMAIVSDAPDMENSTPVKTEKKPQKKSPSPTKASSKKPSAKIAKKAENAEIAFCPIGAEMPVHLL